LTRCPITPLAFCKLNLLRDLDLDFELGLRLLQLLLVMTTRLI